MNRVEVVLLGEYVTNQRIRTQLAEIVETRHVTCDRTNLLQSQTEHNGERKWELGGKCGDRVSSFDHLQCQCVG